MRHADGSRAVVVDFESYPDVMGALFPLEIGIATMGGRTESRCILPRSDWAPGRPSWPGHLPALALAKAEGVDAAALAAWILRSFAGRTVLSDAVHVDQPMLDRLVGKARIRLQPFFSNAFSLAEATGIDKAVLNAWIVEIDALRGEAHRAGEDASVRAVLLRRIIAARGC